MGFEKIEEVRKTYIIKEIAEEAKKKNKEIYCAFLDIEKAYDSADKVCGKY